MKKCTKCNKTKPIKEMKKNVAKWTTKDGVKHKKRSYGICKLCDNTYNRQYFKDNIEKRREDGRKQYWKDHEHTLKTRRAYREKNPPKEYMHGYYEENKEKALLNSEKWRKNNPNARKVIANRYFHKNKAQYLKMQKEKVKTLDDSYMKQLLSKRSSLKHEDITDEMVELKRIEIKLKRALKE